MEKLMSQLQSCPVPECKGKLQVETNRKGQVYWHCSRSPICNLTLSDGDGQPVFPKQIFRCDCKNGILMLRVGYKGMMFWGCSQYTGKRDKLDCRYTYNDYFGKPYGCKAEPLPRIQDLI